MGRSNRQTADYFPHYVGEKSRTKFILEKNWGNDGYAFWFKLLELLCAADGQYYDCWDKMGWEYLLAVTGVTAETAEAILNTLASMGKVDKELWESCRVIWVQSLLENLRQLYSKRTAAPTKPSVDNFPGRRAESPAQELKFKSRANEIIEFAIGTATYGKVRWVGSILTVDGARRAESLNNNYFLNGRHTPLLIMVKGGSLTDDSFAKLKEYMNGIRGEAGQHSFMVLETEAADNRTGFNAENRPEVEVKDLAAILQKDELFQDYLENNRRKVQSAFQLPDLYTGYTTDFNRATAQTAMEVTEKQVFQPERRRLAWAINNRLLNCYQFKYVEVFFRAPDVSNPDDLYKLLTVCNNAGGLTPNKAKSVLYKALGETSEDFPEEWGDIPLAFTNAQQRAAAIAVAGNSPSVAQNGGSDAGKENTQPEAKPTQNAQQGEPSVEEQLDGQIQKAAAANETELVAVMKEVRRLLADMKQEEGDAE